ncbi:MAG: GNAT family N-acetyltransferase, partial [Anaerolineae bacterium]|nr:GNAT family N-acetyltransferase [Anaerolineae bacterium]
MKFDQEIQFHVTRNPDSEARIYIDQQIKAFNDIHSYHHKTTRQVGTSPLDVLMFDDKDQLLGGLVGSTYWGWLDIDNLWLPQIFRGRGYGCELIRLAEKEAHARDCNKAVVKTYSFQARDFYQKQGFRVVGTLRNYPPGQIYY